MYHYVRPDSDKYPFFNNLNLETFAKQLDFFQEKYGFITKESYIEAVKNNKNIKGAVLTFDDGFKDHYKYVLPELKKRNLWGLFYISTGIYTKREVLGVHRVHFLKGRFGADKILKELTSLVDDYMLDDTKIEEFDKEIYQSSSYKKSEKQLRRLLNYYIKYDYRDVVLDSLMSKFFDEQALFDDLYLSKEEIIALKNSGNIIGSHTVHHKVLSRLSYSEQFQEIKTSFDFLDNILNQDYKSFCYPCGYSSSYNEDTLNILKELNVDDACIFDNKIQCDNFSNLELSRIDCNNFIDL
jgi:peptidoglycan/xylan/chitin deacetylase (PgdA/CDA1 family)